LETSHLHVKEIRIKVGATHEAHFLEDFKRKFGETPNNYRNIYQNSRNR
jgi:transcriptional regulator GlxA family with amidase domain